MTHVLNIGSFLFERTVFLHLISDHGEYSPSLGLNEQRLKMK